MGKRILAFAGTNSKKSINKELIKYTTTLIESKVIAIDLNDYDCPIHTQDQQTEDLPKKIQKLAKFFKEANAFIISLETVNFSFAVVYQNIMNWLLEANKENPKELFDGRPVLLMGASEDGLGGKLVLEQAQNVYPDFGADVVGTFSLPMFGENFKEGRVVDEALDEKLREAATEFNLRINEL